MDSLTGMFSRSQLRHEPPSEETVSNDKSAMEPIRWATPFPFVKRLHINGALCEELDGKLGKGRYVLKDYF